MRSAVFRVFYAILSWAVSNILDIPPKIEKRTEVEALEMCTAEWSDLPSSEKAVSLAEGAMTSCLCKRAASYAYKYALSSEYQRSIATGANAAGGAARPAR